MGEQAVLESLVRDFATSPTEGSESSNQRATACKPLDADRTVSESLLDSDASDQKKRSEEGNDA